MTQKELEQKVIDAEGRVAKREAVLKKHNSQLAKMIEKGADRFDISIKREDIKSATCKLAEARETLANWQDKLNTRITRDAYLEANTPEILKDFLENWKQHAIGYYREKRIRFIEYREGLKAKERAARLEALQTLPSLEKYRELYKGRELTDYDLANLWPRRDVDAFLSERGLEYHQIQKKLREAGDQITLRLLEIHNEDEREAWLEKTMEEEKRAKLLDLIGRIMSTVGTITDAAALYIGPEGDINGIIVGTEGKAKIQTIGAGGYNIQCFHFRTLIHEILKGDFSKFFYTLLHSYCYETARRALKWLKDPELIDFAEWLLWLIIDSTPDPGIPIGNQSSQLLALLYLDAFDHWLRDDRGLVYGRYMDDFYIIHSDKLLLRQILKEIEAYIKPLGLRLNGKTQILPLKNGIDFLGFHTYLTQTGKVVRKVRAKSIDNMKRKIRKFRGLVDSGKMTLDSVVQSYASWTGHISHGNTYHLRQNMDAYFFSYFPELKPSPKGDTTHGPKTEQPRKQVEGQVRQPVRQPDHLDRGR